MKYKTQKELQNTYPTDYYIQEKRILVEGKENTLSLDLPSIKNLKYVNDTTFPFIIKFYKNPNTEGLSENVQLWTSEAYYNLIKQSITDANPFYSINSSTIITIYLSQLIDTIKSQKQFEDQLGLDITKILGINTVDFSDIDYSIIIKYIDWVVQSDRNIDTSLIPTAELVNINVTE